MRRFFSHKTLTIFLPLVLFLTNLNAGEMSKAAADHAYRAVGSAVERWASENIPNLRLLEIEALSRNNNKPDIRFISILSLSESEYQKYLSQISFSTYDNRETINVGLVWRSANQAKTLIYGFNTFYDYELNSNHSRLGLGLELKSSVYDVNINVYAGLSDKKNYEGSLEEAADGYDIEVGMYVPYVPWAKVYYKGYEWTSSIFNVKHGETLSLQFKPSDRLTIEAGRQRDNTMTVGQTFIQVNYALCCGNKSNNKSVAFISPIAYSYQSVEDRFFERVRRANRIVKGVKGTVAVGRGS